MRCRPLRLLLVTGCLWPFVVASAGVAVISTGRELRSDAAIDMLTLASLLGSPALFVVLFRLTPTHWSEDRRYLVAYVLLFPVLAVELYLALIVLVTGANWTGYGWLE